VAELVISLRLRKLYYGQAVRREVPLKMSDRLTLFSISVNRTAQAIPRMNLTPTFLLSRSSSIVQRAFYSLSAPVQNMRGDQRRTHVLLTQQSLPHLRICRGQARWTPRGRMRNAEV